MEKSELRTLFESEYPGKKAIFENLIQPIFTKAKDTTLSKEMDITEGDKKQIKSFSIIAQVRGGFPITFADVEVKDTVALKRSRVNIQNCVRKMMANDSNAIIFFHFTDNKSEWRVSYCHRATTNKESTDAKRFTYLCGTEHACRTIAERFDTLQGLTTIKDDDMLEAFGVEPLSKEFFDQYRNHYANLVEYISGKRFIKKGGKFVEEKTKNANGAFKDAFGGDDKLVRDYVKKMMGRLVFLHFLQKKGWLGVAEDSSWGNGDKNFIFNLFENSSEDVKKDFLEQALEPLFFKTLNTDRGEDAIAPKAICDIYGSKIRIPYLNGGLFEEDELDKKKVKFKTLLEFFNQYNFTIDETDPEDQEIGVDPEMLGKIFENLLEDNKDKGAFYTPKEIVQYMCRESLIAYLEEKTKIDARTFVINHEVNFTDSQKADVSKALLDVKICDPAVGSGAFPMGMLNELLACTQLLVGDSKTRSYLKKHIVKNNIYGVDIEKGAVDIARLRFWLAIIVDEEEPIPLPNLDYKIMQGNSLLECYDGIDLSKMLEKPEYGLDYNEEQRKLLKTNMDEYFDDNNHEDKNNKNEVIKALVYDLVCATCGYKPNSQKALEMQEKIWEGTTDFFLWHTWFNDVFNRPNNCNGFDIVISNPPYIRELGNEQIFVSVNSSAFGKKYHCGKMDYWFYFLHKAIELSYNNSILTFITSRYWLKSTGAKKLIAHINSELSFLQIIDVGNLKVFDNVVGNHMISLYKKCTTDNCLYKLVTEDITNIEKQLFAEERIISRNNLISGESINIENDTSSLLLAKIESFKDNEILFKATQGIVENPSCLNKKNIANLKEKGFNTENFYEGQEVFVVCKETLNKLSLKKEEMKLVVPYHEPNEIERYDYSTKTNKYLFYITKENVHNINDYPNIKNHLIQFKAFMEQRRETINHSNKWFHLHWPRTKDIFENEKILYPQMVEKPIFCYTSEPYYVNMSTNIIIKQSNINLKCLLGILNSKLGIFYISNKAKKRGIGFDISVAVVNNFPVNKEILSNTRIPEIVDKIILAKKQSQDTSKLEAEIDTIVYKLYKLLPEEIKLLENV